LKKRPGLPKRFDPKPRNAPKRKQPRKTNWAKNRRTKASKSPAETSAETLANTDQKTANANKTLFCPTEAKDPLRRA
jgi:hypothetical protein